MEWIKKTGSNVKQFAYSTDSKTLTVEFNNGSIYNYTNVPIDIFNQMKEAKSVGSVFAKEIKGKYYHTQIK